MVFGLYGGSVSDAVDRRRLCCSLSSLLVWAAPLGCWRRRCCSLDSPWLLLALVAVQSVGFALSSPVRGAILPRLLPVGQVPAANTLNFTVSSAGAVVGPLLAGLILARWSLRGGVRRGRRRCSPSRSTRRCGCRRCRRSADHARPGCARCSTAWRSSPPRPVLLMSFAVDIVAMVLAMPRALFPEVATTRFHDEGAVGWLFAAIAIGSVLGGLFSGWIGRVRRQGRGADGGGRASGGSRSPRPAWSRTLWVTVALLAVAGAADLVSAVYRQTILQTYAPDEMRGRMQGVFIVVVAGGPRLGDLRAGATAAAFGATFSWVAGGIACVLVVIGLAVAVPALVRYRKPYDADPVPAEELAAGNAVDASQESP